MNTIQRALVLAAIGLASSPLLAGDTARLVLKGYDPVAYFTEGKPVKGDPGYSYEWDEGRYYFANAKHRAMFTSSPERYAPQFGGYCTASMSRGVRNEGHPEAWVISDGQLYVFGAQDARMAAETRQKALADPAYLPARIPAATKNWAEGRKRN
jgi:YHS domain-containing protein